MTRLRGLPWAGPCSLSSEGHVPEQLETHVPDEAEIANTSHDPVKDQIFQ
jgi:hypothetical protein